MTAWSIAALIFENMLQLSQVLGFGDPSRLYAGGIEVWKTEPSHPAYSSPSASCRRNAGLATTATVDLHQGELSNRQSTGTSWLLI